MSGSKVARLMVVGVLAVWCAGPAWGRGEAKKTLHVQVDGLLDTEAVGREVVELIREGRNDGVEVVVLELSGDAGREDVAWMIGQEVMGHEGDGEKGVSTIVWLRDERDKRVGLAQMCIGLLADRCYVSPGTGVMHGNGDGLEWLMPNGAEGEEAERLERELSGAVWVAVRGRGVEPALAGQLVEPRDGLWASRDEEGVLRVVRSEPIGDRQRVELVSPSVWSGEDDATVKMSDEVLVELGLADGRERRLGRVLAGEGVIGRPMVRERVESVFKKTRTDVERMVGAIEHTLDRVDRLVYEARRARGPGGERVRDERLDEAEELLGGVEGAVVEVEGWFERVPELLRVRPGDATGVNADRGDNPALWEHRFQRIRDRAERLGSDVRTSRAS